MIISKKLLNGLLIAFAAIVIIVFGSLIYFQSRLSSPALPQSFLEAREGAAKVSKQIVELTSATNEKVKVVNLSDLSGKPYQALTLIQEARQMNALAQSHAFDLARLLQKLAQSLGEIKSRKGQRLAYEAVAVELSLVSEFISYTQDLSKFLEALSSAIITGENADRQAAERYLKEVNTRVVRINDINNEFLTKMGTFDNSL